MCLMEHCSAGNQTGYLENPSLPHVTENLHPMHQVPPHNTVRARNAQLCSPCQHSATAPVLSGKKSNSKYHPFWMTKPTEQKAFTVYLIECQETVCFTYCRNHQTHNHKMQGSEEPHHSQQLFLQPETLKQRNRKNYAIKIKPSPRLCLTLTKSGWDRKPGLSGNKTELQLVFKDHWINGNS